MSKSAQKNMFRRAFYAKSPELKQWEREIRQPSAPGLFKVSVRQSGFEWRDLVSGIIQSVFGKDLITADAILSEAGKNGSAPVVRGRSFDAAIEFADEAMSMARRENIPAVFQVLED